MTEEKRDPAVIWKMVRKNTTKILSLDSEKLYLEMARCKLLTAAEGEQLGAEYGDDYKSRMRWVLNKSLPQKAEEQFSTFCECLEVAGFEGMEAFRKDAPDSRPDQRLRSKIDVTETGEVNFTVEDVLHWSYPELNEACINQLKKDFTNEQQCRLALLGDLKRRRKDLKPATTPPIDTSITEKIKELHWRQKEFKKIIDDVRNFVNGEDTKSCLKDLGITKMDTWMTDGAFEKCEKESTQNPSILVAGLTSAGKSTFLNSLLGCQLLPASHDACTSILCEINHSDKKTAKVLYKGKTEPVSLNLENGDREEFLECVTTREKVETLQIFWPCQFLKYCTLLDSCGVGENFSSPTFAIKLIEKCQESKVFCGLIFILDATRSPEEAVKGARLIQRCRASLDPTTCLFVLNKFDEFSSTTTLPRKDEYLEKVKFYLAEFWPGFKENQLICMNSQLALEVVKCGVVTKDLKEACLLVGEMLVSGFYHSLLKGLKDVENLTKWIRVTTREKHISLQASEADRVKMRREKSVLVKSCKKKVKEMKKKIDTCLEKLVSDFSQVLRSSDETFAATEINEELLLDMLPHTDVFKIFHKGMEDEMEKEIFEISKELSIITDPERRPAPIYRGIYARAVRNLSEIKKSILGMFFFVIKLLKLRQVVGITGNKEMLERVVRRVCRERIESFDFIYHKIPAEMKCLKKCLENAVSSKRFDGSQMKEILDECKDREIRIWEFRKRLH